MSMQKGHPCQGDSVQPQTHTAVTPLTQSMARQERSEQKVENETQIEMSKCSQQTGVWGMSPGRAEADIGPSLHSRNFAWTLRGKVPFKVTIL